MQSRMEKYHEENLTNNNRTQKNEELYKNIYEDVEYSNIEGVVTSPKQNEVDLSKIRELLKEDEDNKNRIVKEPKSIEYPDMNILDEEKNYDIRDVLSKAKEEKKDDNEQHHSFKNTEYDILKCININEINKPQKTNEEEELKELINTVTNVSALNQMGDKELSLNMLNDLQSTTSIDENEVEKVVEKEPEIDKSFFSLD